MSGASSIEWTDATWNPVRGCSRVSEGCRNCYAERQAARFSKPGLYANGFAEQTVAGPRWTGDVELIPSALDWPLRKRKSLRIFVNSTSDLFHEKLSDEALAAVFGVMAACPQHTFQVLTKRPERMRAWFEWVNARGGLGPYIRSDEGRATLRGIVANEATSRFEFYRGKKVRSGEDGWAMVMNAAACNVGTAPLCNVWLGVSVENQATADERIPLLLQTPAAKRFVSYEPALGLVNFAPHLRRSTTYHVSMSVPGALRNRSFYGLCDDSGREMSPKEAEAALRDLLERGIERIPATSCDAFDEKTGCKGHPNPAIDWVIVGGESGPGARPFDVAWARSTVEQCREAGVAVFVKQLGARAETDHMSDLAGHAARGPRWLVFRHPKGGDWDEWPEDLRVREFPR